MRHPAAQRRQTTAACLGVSLAAAPLAGSGGGGASLAEPHRRQRTFVSAAPAARLHDASPQRDEFASSTVSAVMLTMRRTVADAVMMCTGRAAPSRIGPIVTLLPAAAFSRL
jgi:hypothetical protein